MNGDGTTTKMGIAGILGRALIVIAISLATTGCSDHQSTRPEPLYRVSGTVYRTVNPRDYPLAKVTVTLGEETYRTCSDGWFGFADVPAGEYSIEATTCCCYEHYSATIRVSGKTTHDIYLIPLPAE
jgi:hypothetical protein